MGKLKKLTEKFFKPKLEKAGGNGLYATLEELTEQRRFVPYLKNHQFNHIVSSRAGDVKSALLIIILEVNYNGIRENYCYY